MGLLVGLPSSGAISQSQSLSPSFDATFAGARRLFPDDPAGRLPAERLGDLFAQARPSAAEGSDVLPFHVPEWLKRVDLAVQVGSGKPRFYLETVQPLFQGPGFSHTFFTQPRISVQDGDGTYNLGFGYRNLFFDRQVLGGVNTFLDYTDENDHGRMGIGFELLSRFVEGRANAYLPFTGSQLVKTNASSKVIERALRGFDLEAGGPLPYLPFVKLYGGYAFYDGVEAPDLNRGLFRAEIQLTRALRLDAEAWDDNQNAPQYRMTFAFRAEFRRLEDVLKFFQPAPTPYPKMELKRMVLHRVVREFHIVTERVTKTAGAGASTGSVTVQIGRGT